MSILVLCVRIEIASQTYILNGATEAVVDFYWLVVFVEQLVTLFTFIFFQIKIDNYTRKRFERMHTKQQ